MPDSVWGALIGVVGVLIGAVLSYVVTKVERVSLEKHRQISAIKALIAEIREIQEIANDPKTTTRNTLTKFPSDSWDFHKQYMEILPQQVQEGLLLGYSKLSQANNIAGWALVQPYGAGNLNDSYKEEVKSMRSV